MTDEELIRLLTNFHYAILDSLGQAPVQLDEDGEHRTVDASRAAILSHFDRRKEGEGGEDAQKYRFIRSHDPSDEWRDLPESEAQAFDRVVEKAMAKVAARTEGKGNG